MLQGSHKSLGGGLLHLPIPKPGQIELKDIALRLSNTCRFNGATRSPDNKPLFFSTAQHSMEVSHLCVMYAAKFGVDPNEAALAGLAHDFPEYIYGDIIGPVKSAAGSELKALMDEVDAIVFEGLGITDVMLRCQKLVDWADLEMLISDAARWCVYGNYIVGDKVVKVDKWRIVPEPFELRYSHHIAMPSGSTYQPLIDAYEALHKRIFNK